MSTAPGRLHPKQASRPARANRPQPEERGGARLPSRRTMRRTRSPGRAGPRLGSSAASRGAASPTSASRRARPSSESPRRSSARRSALPRRTVSNFTFPAVENGQQLYISCRGARSGGGGGIATKRTQRMPGSPARGAACLISTGRGTWRVQVVQGFSTGAPVALAAGQGLGGSAHADDILLVHVGVRADLQQARWGGCGGRALRSDEGAEGGGPPGREGSGEGAGEARDQSRRPSVGSVGRGVTIMRATLPFCVKMSRPLDSQSSRPAHAMSDRFVGDSA